MSINIVLLCVLFAVYANASSMRSPSEMLGYFGWLRGKGIVSGQFIERGPIDPINKIYQDTGKWLGMIGGDYWWAGSGSFDADYGFNAIAKSYAAAGGFITLCVSMANPTTGGSAGDTSNLAAWDILKSGTSTNTNFMRMINSIGDGLNDLKNAGVTVIFRPFHENNGNWNWWGVKTMPPAQFQAMWQFVHNYYTNNRGLNNLVWLFAPNAGLNQFPINNYPGSAYVDMIGLSVYTSNPAETAGDFKTLQSTFGKLLCLSEFGPGGPSQGDPSFQEPVLIDHAKNYLGMCVFWQQWWDEDAGHPGWGISSTQNAKAALNDPYVLNRGNFVFNSTLWQ